MTARDQRSSLMRSLFTEEGIYGSVVLAGVIASSSSAGADANATLLFVLVTIIVFWLAHVYAGTMASYGHGASEHSTALTLREALRGSLRRSLGLLAAAVLPSIALMLGAFGALDDGTSVWIALWSGVALLGLIGYLANRARGSKWPACLFGGLTSASFGVLIIIAKWLISH